MITPEEALKAIIEKVKLLPAQSTPLAETLGLVLAENITSRDNIPPFDNSAMDGYAVRVADIAGATYANPVMLEVVADIKAGDVGDAEIVSGTAARIMTGAQVPAGADAVVKVEDTTTKESGERDKFVTNGGSVMLPVEIKASARPGENIRRAGEDIAAGAAVLSQGTAIGPAEIGVLASLGFASVSVYRRARVAVITTGDELIEIAEALKPGKIRNSNAYSLAAQIETAGAEPIRLGIAADTKEDVRNRIATALAKADVILTTGGVSVGQYDVVKDVLEEMGAERIFWKVAQKPGKPLGFWLLDNAFIFGLPGNPVASMVCFEEYVRPAVRKMMGYSRLFRPSVDAILTADIKKKKGRVHLIRVMTEIKNGEYFAASTGPQGSGILKSMVLADGLAIVPADVEFVAAGEKVRTRLITMPEDH